MAMAERFLRDKFGSEVRTTTPSRSSPTATCMEGIASEAASLAGHSGSASLVYLYDDNHIQLDGPTRESDSEDVPKRFEAYGWHDARASTTPTTSTSSTTAIDAGDREEERPTLIRVRSIIGWPSPNKQGTSKAHGSPLGEDEVRLTKEIMGWDPDEHFHVPDGVLDHFAQVERGARRTARGRRASTPGARRTRSWPSEWDAACRPAQPLPGLADALPTWNVGETRSRPRSAGQKVMAAFEPTACRRWSAAPPTCRSRRRPSSGRRRSASRRAPRAAT